MANEERLWSQVEGQRETYDLKIADFFEHILRSGGKARLVMRDVAENARMLLVRNTVECAHWLHCRERLRTREVGRGRSAGGKALLGQIDEKSPVVLAADPVLDRSTGLGIEQQWVVDSQRFGNRMMVALSDSEFGAKVGQCLEALGGFGMAGLEGFGEDCPVSRALLRCSEVRESFGEDVDLVGREPIDWPAFEHIFRPEPHAHQLVA